MTSFVELALPIAIKSIVSGLISFGGDELKKQKNKILTSLKSDKVIDKYIKNSINKVFVFRTLLHGDRNVYLHEVYYPLYIKNITSTRITKIDDNTILPMHSPICIIGIAGQGKTTIMRKLFLEELNKKKNFPVFINLRQVDDFKDLSCDKLLLQHLNSKGIDGDIEDAKYLCENGLISFFFDGFDEIPFNQRMHALKTIEESYVKYNCKVIVTTRPDTEITRQPGYDIYNVEFLKPDSIYDIIVKSINDPEITSNLKNMLKEKTYIRESIKTPILLDIFIVTSRNFRNDPKSITDYYSGLFSALLYRHDLIKNLTREKKSGLVDRELEGCFSLFSFLTFFNDKTDFTRNELLNYFEKSIKANKVNSTPEKISDDIVDGTNLIVKDGYDNFVYIHRSIQEFFSAKFISSMRKDMKQNIYEKLVNQGVNDENTNLLVMASYLDPFCFAELYIINRLLKAKVFTDNKINHVSYEEYIDRVSDWVMVFSKDKGKLFCDSMMSPEKKPSENIDVIFHINSILLNGVSQSYMSAFAHNYMLKLSGFIGEKIKSGELIAEPISGIFNDHRLHTQDENDKVCVTLDVVFSHIQDSDKINRGAYQHYLGLIDNISNFLTLNYFNKIEGDNILGGMVDDLKL